MNRQECNLYNNGKCERFGAYGSCEDHCIENLEGDDERLLQRDVLECCKTMSPHGNSIYLITEADITALREGKWLSLGDDEEYSNFIRYVKE
jgi:hypothetical protein